MASGNFLTTFSDGTNTYTFPAFQSQLRDNFSDMVPRTVRIPGADGGFDQFGTGKAPTEIGNVSVTFEQYADDNLALQTYRDLVRAMAAWGVCVLSKECGDEGTRYCYARVNSITMTEAPNDPVNNQKLTVTVDFQVAEPYWLETGTWGSPVSVTVNGSPQAVNSVGGLFRTYPKITLTVTVSTTTLIVFEVGTGATAQSFQISRAGNFTAGDDIVIDCRSMDVKLNGGNDFSIISTFTHANFVWLEPGNNTVTITRTGGTVTAALEWYERY
jgi:phage-related protein